MPEVQRSVDTQSVLVVEDDPVVRLLACEALSEIGFAAVEAETGQQALEAFSASPPDLVILDVGLPGRDGLEICAELRALAAGRDVPILIMTGTGDSEMIDRAFQAGATDFLAKPVDWPLLQHRARFLIRAQRTVAELRQTLTALVESESRLANSQQLAQAGNWQWDPGAEDMLWSEQIYSMFEIRQEPGASTLAAFLGVAHPDDLKRLEKAITGAAAESRSMSLDHRIVLRDGRERVVRQQLHITPGPSGETYRINGTVQDITDRRRADERIRYLAYYDDLTALPNRKMLTEQLDRVLRRAERSKQRVGLLFVDVDRFKRINDTLGHRLGDSVLKVVADRLFQSVRCTDYIGQARPPESTSLSRLGGDEFVVLLKELSSSADAAHIARRILEGIRAPLTVEGQRIDLSASLGIAFYPEDGTDPETLLGSASVALDQAKDAGRDGYQFFDESMNEKAIRNLQLESGLRAGIERGELTLHYQPQFDAQSGKIVSVEALVRWRSIDYGFISPDEFIPLAEESGLIIPLGEWVLRTACAQNRAWREAGLPPIRVAVNVSSHQVRKGGLVEAVERALRDAPLDPEFLEIEITESALIGNEPGVVETLERLHAMGIRLALDDFGTGYSSLSHLVEFPIDTIKIDQSFVEQIGASPTAEAITSAVVTMGHNLGLEVVAEGVETEEQQQFLHAKGCELIQGYLYSKPVEADELEKLLRRPKQS